MSELLAKVAEILRGYRFSFCNEVELQEGVAAALEGAWLTFERECRLSARDRIDFLVAGDERWSGAVLGVEAKIDHGLTALTRQLMRYASYDRVGALLVVTSCHRLTRLPEILGGKPLAVVRLGGGF